MSLQQAATPPEPLFSARWHRVAGLCPRLRPQVELRRQVQRGVDWFLIVDSSADEVRRINPAAYQLVGRFDGRTPVQQLWEALLEAAPEQAMTQNEVVQLLVALHGRQLIEFDRAPDVEAVFRGRDRVRSRRRWQVVNPLAFRLPLVDPSRWLRPLLRPSAWLFSATGLLLWSLLVLAALLAAAPHAAEIASEASRLMRSPQALAAGWLLYPLIKLVHESAHALAMMRWGLMPRQAGITLLVLTPVPFVDASAADTLRHPHQRAVVSAAGILAELAIAALAFGVWLAVEPGTVRDLALTAVLIGTVSTLLVNGNPLLRFDGYFVFTDLLDLRNLGTRSARWWRGRLRAALLADRHTPPMECLPGERRWLIAYAPLSTAYRLGLSLLIALWVGSFSSLLGLVVGGLMFSITLGLPLLAGLKALAAQHSAVAWLRVGAALGLLALLLAWPLPHRTLVQGVVWPAEQALIRAGTDGFVAEWLQADGQTVQAGDVVARLEDEELAARRASLLADATELDVQLFTALASAPDEAVALRERLAFSQAEIARLDERLTALAVRAQTTGTLVLPRQQDQQGRFLRRGELLGHVLSDAPLTLRVALPQHEAELLRDSAPEVQVRLASAPQQVQAGRIVRDLSGAVFTLPSAALSDRAGGPLATAPDDPDGLRSASPVVLLDIAVSGLGSRQIGERAHVRLDHGERSLAVRWARQLRQLLLRHFNPSV